MQASSHERGFRAFHVARLCTLALALALIPTAALNAHPANAATPGVSSTDPGDMTNAASRWHWVHGLSADELRQRVENETSRILDLRAERGGAAPRFGAALVTDPSTSRQRWGWASDLTATQLEQLLTGGAHALTRLVAWEAAPDDVHFAAVWSGEAPQPANQYEVVAGASPAQAALLLARPGVRPVAIARYLAGREERVALALANGAPSDLPGRTYVAGDANAVALAARSGGSLIADLERTATGRVAGAILEACGADCSPAWRELVASGDLARVLESADGLVRVRLASEERPLKHGFSMWAQALPSITARVSALLAVTDGTQGLYLKEVGGGILANQNENFVYEPASSIKIAPHLHVMQQVEANAWALTDLVNIYSPPPPPSSCPGNTDIGDEMLSKALQEMLWHSDNSRTRVIVDTFGQANINATMAAAGMTSSSINHIIGCGGPIPDQLTLVDAGILYEGVADGTLIQPGNRSLFFSFTAGKAQFAAEGYDWTGLWDTDIPAMLIAEAPAGMSSSQRSTYRSWMDLGYKAGNYNLCADDDCTSLVYDISITGWASIPFCTGTSVGDREYAFGVFIEQATSQATAGLAFSSSKAELLREQINAGMSSCFAAYLSLDIDSAPDPVESGSQYTVSLSASNAGPMSADGVTISGNTPAGTAYAGAVAPPGWTISSPAGGVGTVTFSKPSMLAGESAEFQVTLDVDCAVADGTLITDTYTIASATTPDPDASDDTDSADVTVSNPPPVIGPVSVDPEMLWPPNHAMRTVAVSYEVTDNCGEPACTLSVVSSEPDEGLGDGDTAGDIEVVDAHTVRLRAERSGLGTGRSYTISVTCGDEGGGSSDAEVVVSVPKSKKP